MNSIKEKTVIETEVKKSKFIAIALPIENKIDVQKALDNIKKEYVSASHYTYAYVLGDLGIIQKATDDGEPTRTAGYPILQVIQNNNLTNILIIVVRYFGGTLLGTGGLIRAYSGAAARVVKNTISTKKITTYECLLTCSYENIGSIDKFIREHTSLQTVSYNQDITFTFQVSKEKFTEVKKELFNRNNYKDTLKIIGESSKYI